MAKKKHGFKRQNGFKIPLAPIIGMVPLAAESWNIAAVSPAFPSITAKGKALGQLWVSAFTGYDVIEKRFRFEQFKDYGLPVLMGVAVHKLANMIGLNRIIAGARIPIIRI